MPYGILKPRRMASGGQTPLGPRDNLVCCLRMEQAAGNEPDWTGRRNTAVALAGVPGSAAGLIGLARTFDGATQGFLIGPNNADFANLPSFWCNGDFFVTGVPAGNCAIWSQGPVTPANCSFRVYAGSDGKVHGTLWDTATTQHQADDTVAYLLNAWNHFAFWWDAVQLAAFLSVNGRPPVSISVPLGINQVAAANCVVGVGTGNTGGGNFWPAGGMLDNLHFWLGRIPTQADRDILMNAGRGFDAFRRGL